MRRFDIPVDQPVLVNLAQRRGDADSQAQEGSDLQRSSEQSGEWLASPIIEQQCGPSAFALKRQRPHCPFRVQLVPQCVFVSQAIETCACGMFCGRLNDQHGLPASISVLAPTSPEGRTIVRELVNRSDIFPRPRNDAIPKQRVQRIKGHYPISDVGLPGHTLRTPFRCFCWGYLLRVSKRQLNLGLDIRRRGSHAIVLLGKWRQSST